ncbi:hypothetical protein [Pseudomonas fluvialis]|uniref:hypothetical protein n=1 Tax=Pseudomonas fluvialis TaxID=1793966 RepID=UPI00160A02B1|nr:hypothetical protein [Pseudomonas fluvialis]
MAAGYRGLILWRFTGCPSFLRLHHLSNLEQKELKVTELFSAVECRLNELHTRYLQSSERRLVLGAGLILAVISAGLIALVNSFFDMAASYPSLFLIIGVSALGLVACIAVIQAHTENRFCRAEVLKILQDLETSGFKLYRSDAGRLVVSKETQYGQKHLYPFTAAQWNEKNLWSLRYWQGESS